MSQRQAPYLAIQEDLLLSMLEGPKTKQGMAQALRVIIDEYHGYGRLIVEFRNKKVFLVGQEGTVKMDDMEG